MTIELVERLVPFATSMGIELDSGRRVLLARFVEVLEAWNRRLPLTGDRAIESLVLKHCADSIAMAPELVSGSVAFDVGSGGGFPGLVAACVRVDVDLVLVDSRSRSCSFLRHASSALGLTNVQVVCDRIESVAVDHRMAGEAAIVSARAVNIGPIAMSLARLLHTGGSLALMLAGAQAAPEDDLEAAGFAQESERRYTLPTGEARRIARYVRR